jgi:hypothetical protein
MRLSIESSATRTTERLLRDEVPKSKLAAFIAIPAQPGRSF